MATSNCPKGSLNCERGFGERSRPFVTKWVLHNLKGHGFWRSAGGGVFEGAGSKSGIKQNRERGMIRFDKKTRILGLVACHIFVPRCLSLFGAPFSRGLSKATRHEGPSAVSARSLICFKVGKQVNIVCPTFDVILSAKPSRLSPSSWRDAQQSLNRYIQLLGDCSQRIWGVVG